MTTTNPLPRTSTQTARIIKTAIRVANSDVAATMDIAVRYVSPPCEYRDGSGGKFRNVICEVSADGYRTRIITGSVDLQTGKIHLH